MTRKEYTAIAAIIAANQDLTELAKDLAEYFASANPKFDIIKFMRACRNER